MEFQKSLLKAVVYLLCVLTAPVYAGNSVKEEPKTVNKSVVSPAGSFTFTYSPNLFDYKTRNPSQSDVKLFGQEVAQLIALLDEACVKYNPADPDYKPRLVKPVLYNAVTKAISYFRKEMKRGKIDKQQAISQVEDIVRKGYVCVYEETEELENQLSQVSSPKEILDIMNRVIITSN